MSAPIIATLADTSLSLRVRREIAYEDAHAKLIKDIGHAECALHELNDRLIELEDARDEELRAEQGGEGRSQRLE